MQLSDVNFAPKPTARSRPIAPITVAVALTEASLLANLEEHAQAARGAFAAATERALRADSFVYSAWCADSGLLALPAAPATVAAFIDAMGEAKATATVRRYVASISTLHRAAGVPNPCADLAVKLALKRLHRAKGRAQAQAAPLTRAVVDRLLGAAGPSLRDVRNRAVLAVAYDTLCRRSELAALQRADLESGADGAGTVTLRRSKTDPEGHGAVRFLAPDTMRLVVTWLAAAEIDDGPLFRAVRKGGRVGGALDGVDAARIFKAMAKAAGLPAETVATISGHSTRVGAAQDMVREGIELPAIMQAGGWKSAEMVSRYTAKLDARRSAAAKLAVMQNRA